MKHLKKAASLLLVLVLALSLTVPAWAYDININTDKENHIYEAYQVFKGDLDQETETILSNIEWGENITVKSGAFTKEVNGENVDLSAAEVAERMSNDYDGNDKISLEQFLAGIELNQPYKTSAVKTGGYIISDLPAGYYLVKDADGSQEGKADAYTDFILQVVETVDVTPKSAVPEVDKAVQENTDANAPEWAENDTADHNINESFQFKLTATLSADENYAAYEKYKVVFTDTMSEGVTFDSIESVKVNGESVGSYDCTATVGQAGGEWTLTIEDIKGYATDLSNGAIVEVIYNAHLNEKALVDHDPNNNKVDLQYSNDPNGTGMGKTPEDYVWVFTYKMDNTKVNGQGTPLANAGFRLYRDENCTVEIPLIYDAERLAYRPVKAGEQGVEMMSAEETGKFDIIGLDQGTYYLKETTTPDGYNTLENPIKVDIKSDTAEAKDGASATADITMTQDGENATAISVVNNSGAVLPETGGIGTTIFYTVGGILVVGAAVLLVTKKRMHNN